VDTAINSGCYAHAERFNVVGTLTSPMNWLGPQFATQIWFIAQKRGAR
jgi:hypothetical protein